MQLLLRNSGVMLRITHRCSVVAALALAQASLALVFIQRILRIRDRCSEIGAKAPISQCNILAQASLALVKKESSACNHYVIGFLAILAGTSLFEGGAACY